jgi:hypothetical protein
MIPFVCLFVCFLFVCLFVCLCACCVENGPLLLYSAWGKEWWEKAIKSRGAVSHKYVYPYTHIYAKPHLCIVFLDLHAIGFPLCPTQHVTFKHYVAFIVPIAPCVVGRISF